MLLTQPNNDRLVVLPVQSQRTFEYYKQAVASFWTVEEVDLTNDLRDWNDRLSEPERHFVENVLAFFATSDGIVNENLAANFYAEVQLAEARLFYGMQIAIEGIHAEMYSLLIDTYVRDTRRKQQLLSSVHFPSTITAERDESTRPEHTHPMPWIQLKADFAHNYINARSKNFAERIVAFACVEGIFFSASFCAIYWLKKRGVMPGLTFSNELISRDEGLHTDFAAHLYRDLIPEDQKQHDVTRNILQQAVDVELNFVRQSLPVAVIGMNADLMCEYVRYVANRLHASLCPNEATPLFSSNCNNPFDFMNMISITQKTNFFESRVSSYARANLQSDAAGHEGTNVTDTEF